MTTSMFIRIQTGGDCACTSMGCLSTIDLREIVAVTTHDNPDNVLGSEGWSMEDEDSFMYDIHMKSGTIFTTKEKTDRIDGGSWLGKWMVLSGEIGFNEVSKIGFRPKKAFLHTE
jgi:hypothetical protein